MSHRNKWRPAFRLTEVLTAEGISLRQLAIKLNADYRGLRRIAQGSITPRWQFAVRIADALGVPLDEFAHRQVRPLPPPGANGDGYKGGAR